MSLKMPCPPLATLTFLHSLECYLCFVFGFFEFVMFKGDGKEQTQLMYEHHEPSTFCSIKRGMDFVS